MDGLLRILFLVWIQHGEAVMDIRQFLTDKPPPLIEFADPGMPPPSYMYALGQYSPPYDITVDTLEPYPGCDAYHSSVCAVQHAIRLVTQAREEACPMLEAGGSLREAALANITGGAFQAVGTRGFGVWVVTEDGTVVADQLHPYFVGQPVNGYMISGFVAQGGLLGYIDWVTRHGGGFVPHFSTRLSELWKPIATSTYFEKCLTGERIGVSFGRAALPYSTPCDASYDSFCAMAICRSHVGSTLVDLLNANSAKEVSESWHATSYDWDYPTQSGEGLVFEYQIPLEYYPLYPDSMPGTNDGPLLDNYNPVMSVGSPVTEVYVGENATRGAEVLAQYGTVVDFSTASDGIGAAYRGGAWQDLHIVDWLGSHTRVAFVAGVVLNRTGYAIEMAFTHQPNAAASAVHCSACSADFASPCTITNALRLFASAKAEFLTPGGDWREISSSFQYGSVWPSALAQAAEGAEQPWPPGFMVVAVDYNRTVVGHGAVEAVIGQDVLEVFGNESAHSQALKAADSGGAWVKFKGDDEYEYIVLVQKAAKLGRFYYMGVMFRKAWTSWDSECTSQAATPCAEANVQALVGMATAELLGSADLTELQAKLAEVTNRTGNFSEEVRGDFAAHVLSAELACLDGAVCEAESWPLYWMNLLKEAISVEEGSWVSLPASGTYKASRAFLYSATWQELDGLDDLEFVVIALVLDAYAAPACSSQSDCPPNSVCTSSGCECEGGFLANVTEVDDACSVLKATTVECLDVSGMVCEDSGRNCVPCPGGYTCYSGVAFPCGVGVICPEGSVAEEYCPAGTMGVESLATSVSSCQLCQPGNFSDSEGATACSQCGVGTFSSSEGAVSCTRCGIGTYQASLGKTSCSECLPGFTTAYQAAISLSDCICPAGTYMPLDGKSCQSCVEGIECTEANTTEASIVPVTSPRYSTSNESWPVPQAAVGYMSLPSNGLAAYRCKETDWCPGGAPGACASNRDPWSIGCSRCVADHYTNSDGSCSKCNSAEVIAMMLGSSVVAFLGLAFVARSVNRNPLKQPHSITTSVIAFGLLVTSIQTLGILATLSVTWVKPLGSWLRALQVFAGDLKVMRVECMVGTDSVGSAILRLGISPVAALYIASVVAFRKLVIDSTVEFNVQTMNAVGAVYQLFFVSIFVSVLTPFVCYQHPGDLGYSMLDDPAILCSWEGEHWDLTVVSLSAAVVVVLPYLTLVVYATGRYRSAMTYSLSGYRHLRRFQFLFFRYRPGCYWYGLITLLRGVLVCLTPVVFRDIPSMQILGLCVTLLGICALQMNTNPWRSAHANMMDAGINILLVLLLVCVAMSTEFPDIEKVVGILGVVLLLAVFAVAGVVASAALYRHLRPHPYYARFICHHKADAAAQARYLQLLFQVHTQQLCFLDSDHLTNLEELFDIVRVRCGELIVYLTADTMKRPWCAGEITIAWQVHQNVVAICHPSFSRPTDEQLEAMEGFLAPGDFKLSEYGITFELIEGAFKWFLNQTSRTFHLNMNLAGRTRFEDVVESVLHQGCSRRNSTMAYSGSHILKPGCIVVSSVPQEDEATAAVGIILRLIQPSLLEIVPDGGLSVLADMPSDARWEAVEAVGTARAVLVVLSAQSLASDEQLSLICSAVSSDTAYIPINLPSFRFPAPDFYSELPSRFTDKGEEVLTTLPMFFKIICVPFTTFASEEVLHVQAESIIPRIPKTRTSANGSVSTLSHSLSRKPSERPLDTSTCLSSVSSTNGDIEGAFQRKVQCALRMSSDDFADAKRDLQDQTVVFPGFTHQC